MTKRKSINIEEIIEENIPEMTPTLQDMVIVTAEKASTKDEVKEQSRLARLEQGMVIQHQEGSSLTEEFIDLGVRSAKEIKEDMVGMLLKHREENDKASKEVIDGLHGLEPQNLVENDMEEIVSKIRPDRKALKGRHQDAIDKIIEDLLK